MRLKHIKLFENFQAAPSLDQTMVFDWMPYDAEVSNPIQSSIPETISFMDLPNFIKESAADLPSLEKAGLFIAHNKLGNGGFNRVIVSKLDPLTMDLSIFDSNYEKTGEYKDIQPSDISDVSKGSSLLGKFGISSLDNDAE